MKLIKGYEGLRRQPPAIQDEETAGGSVIDTTVHLVIKIAFVFATRNLAETVLSDIHQDNLG